MYLYCFWVYYVQKEIYAWKKESWNMPERFLNGIFFIISYISHPLKSFLWEKYSFLHKFEIRIKCLSPSESEKIDLLYICIHSIHMYVFGYLVHINHSLNFFNENKCLFLHKFALNVSLFSYCPRFVISVQRSSFVLFRRFSWWEFADFSSSNCEVLQLIFPTTLWRRRQILLLILFLMLDDSGLVFSIVII